MTDLLKKKCLPCEGGAIPFDISEIHKYQKKVDGWNIIKDNEGIHCLEKNFKFKNFLKSLYRLKIYLSKDKFRLAQII